MTILNCILLIFILILLYFIKKVYEKSISKLADHFIDWVLKKFKRRKDKNDDDDYIDFEFI